MKYRRFGRTNWQVSEIGYGMWGMGGWTGWGYGEGHSEALLGQIIRANPDRKLYTATKIPPKNFIWPSRREFSLDDCFPPDHIEEYVTSSLNNSGLESFDLMQFHVWEDHFVEDERWVNRVADLKGQGLFNAIGISINRWEPWNAIQTVNSGLIDAVQVIYNIFDQQPDDELLPACEAHDVAVIARVPLDEGTLTGNITLDSTWPEDDWRSSYFVPDNLKSSVAHADPLRDLLPPDMSMPEMALRFILNESRVQTIIPGMRKSNHVKMNIAASDSGPLSEDLVG